MDRNNMEDISIESNYVMFHTLAELGLSFVINGNVGKYGLEDQKVLTGEHAHHDGFREEVLSKYGSLLY